MKKIFIAIIAFIGCCSATNASDLTPQQIMTTSDYHFAQNVVFRSTQILTASDGRQIRLYRNGTCELRDGDRIEVTCRYRLQDGEVRLLDEYGNTVYAGSYKLRKDRRNIDILRLSGTTYFNRR